MKYKFTFRHSLPLLVISSLLTGAYGKNYFQFVIFMLIYSLSLFENLYDFYLSLRMNVSYLIKATANDTEIKMGFETKK